MAAYPWQHRFVRRYAGNGRHVLDCGHAVASSYAQRSPRDLDCPGCFRAWWETPGNRSDGLLKRSAWRRLHDLAYPEPPPIGVRVVPVQVALLPLDAA